MKGVHMDNIKKRLGNLLSVKSLVTLSLTIVFAVLALRGDITGKDFLTIFLTVVTFYFGTQSQKAQDAIDNAGTPQEGEQK
jgi:hypothetical protein|nr:MAG TPA: hypothetical protein [Caudoviricetes sp.]DAQ83735.1 MAG TPA: hypothetical protein [Caudoviricetes sp.]